MALVSPLLRLENNHCHIEESEYVLKKAHKYSELIILYEKKGLHRKGEVLLLQHLRRHPAPPHNHRTHLLHIYTFEVIIRKRWIFPPGPASGSAPDVPSETQEPLLCSVYRQKRAAWLKGEGPPLDGAQLQPPAPPRLLVHRERRRLYSHSLPGLVPQHVSSERSWFPPP